MQFGDGIDVLLVVAPTAAQMGKVRLLGERWGMDKLIILLNCDVDGAKAPVHLVKYIDSEFDKVYFYRPNPHPKWSGGVLFRKFPDGASMALPLHYYFALMSLMGMRELTFTTFYGFRCLLHVDWVLCRQPPVGFLKEILTKESQPSLEEIEAALKDEGNDPATGIMNKLSSFLGND